MRQRTILAALILAVLTWALPAEAQQSPDPNSPRFQGVMALQEFFQSEGDEALHAFAEDRIAASYREELGDELMSHLTALREMFAGLESRGARPTGPLGATVMFPDDKSVSFTLDEDDPSRFSSIRSSQ